MKKLFYIFILISIFLIVSCTTVDTGENIESLESEEENTSFIIEQVDTYIYRLKANKNRGYNYDAYIYLPYRFSPRIKNYLLVIPNNSGKTGTLNEHDKYALWALAGNWERKVADGVLAPLLMPVFPRENDELYFHNLTYAAFTATGKNKRIDKQLICMMNDTLEFLEEFYSFEFQNKVLMMGTSASGMFVSRFTVLHPELVQSVVTGLNTGLPMFPIDKIGKQSIGYPFGIADIKSIAGQDFDLESFKEVKILSMNGGLDEDTLKDNQGADMFYPATKKIVFDIAGWTIKDRSNFSYSIYSGYTNNFQNILYEGVGHKAVTEDAITFLRQNRGDEFVPLEETTIPTILNQYKIQE